MGLLQDLVGKIFARRRAAAAVCKPVLDQSDSPAAVGGALARVLSRRGMKDWHVIDRDGNRFSVSAMTKSEARARAKTHLQLNPRQRLPPGYTLARVR